MTSRVHDRRGSRPGSKKESVSPLDRALLALERPARLWLAAGVAVILVGLAIQRVTLGGRPTYLGKYYAMLAADPFHPAPDNPVAHRILAPLLSWMIGLRGIYFLYTCLAFVLVLLALTYLWFRGRGHPPGPSWARRSSRCRWSH